ncbi:MAG: hypothetical protein IJ849_04760 [Selenomonadaceae bacterium]|nr:hypothetical protein [Selenomonadaceae bacterium]
MGDFADKFAAHLEKTANQRFRREDLEDAQHSVIFRSSVSIKGQHVPLGVIFDDSIYVIVRANLASHAVNDRNDYEVSHFIARRNFASKLFKYYLTPDTSVVLDACIPMLPDNFSPELIETVIRVVIKELAKHQRELTELIWQGQEES